MRNRAKCRVCTQIIESKTRHDFVTCPCGEVSVDGGQDYFKCVARNFENFVRIDDEDNEVPVKYVENELERVPDPTNAPLDTFEDKLKFLKDLIDNGERGGELNSESLLVIYALLRDLRHLAEPSSEEHQASPSP